jgi:uncharacterized membrane protein YgdD (TMEM256/DUF423 family)
MHKSFLSIGAFLGALAVVLGAFAAHGLKKIASVEDVAVFQTGVQYQMYHALALIMLSIIYERVQNNWVKSAGYCYSFGILFFSGSLYLITALKTGGKDIPAMVGIITPAGGLIFIVGWLSLLIGVLKKR